MLLVFEILQLPEKIKAQMLVPPCGHTANLHYHKNDTNQSMQESKASILSMMIGILQ